MRHAFGADAALARQSAASGHFFEVLVELSHSADLLILGVNGRHTGIGRDDLSVAAHAQCPVIVVRESLTPGGA